MSTFRLGTAIERPKSGHRANSTPKSYNQLLRVPPQSILEMQSIIAHMVASGMLLCNPSFALQGHMLSPLKRFLTYPFAPALNKFNCIFLCTAIEVIYDSFSSIHP